MKNVVYIGLNFIIDGIVLLNVYDKNGLKIVIYVVKNKFREDVKVMVVFIISININFIKNFVF